METNQLQQDLFSYLKSQLPPHLSMVDELCDLLDLSADSVYRRIRGEKPITLTELKGICEHYNLSIDQLLKLENETVLFQAPGMINKPANFLEYMLAMKKQFEFFNSHKQKELHYLCKDAPFWYFYLFPHLAAFKTFFWSKTISNYPEYHNKKFSFAEFPFHDCFKVGQDILKLHNELVTVELWNLESINSTINQIQYYQESGFFKSKEDMELVVNSLLEMMDHLQLQAEKGVKFMPGATDVSYKAAHNFYVNELILGNNTILLLLEGQRVSMITYSVFNYLITRDLRFSDKAFETFNTLLSRSQLISTTGEKDRIRFFNCNREKIQALLR